MQGVASQALIASGVRGFATGTGAATGLGAAATDAMATAAMARVIEKTFILMAWSKSIRLYVKVVWVVGWVV